MAILTFIRYASLVYIVKATHFSLNSVSKKSNVTFHTVFAMMILVI